MQNCAPRVGWLRRLLEAIHIAGEHNRNIPNGSCFPHTPLSQHAGSSNLPAMALSFLLLAAAASLFSSACSQQPAQAQAGQDDIPVQQVQNSDPGMNAAIGEAQRTVPHFLAVLRNPPEGTSDLWIKYPLEGTEHIWVENLRQVGNRIEGRLMNVPIDERYKLGQVVSVSIAEVSDWAYRDAQGMVQGNRTTRYLLPRLNPADAASVREQMGWRD